MKEFRNFIAFTLFFGLCFISIQLDGQFLSNPSFEGSPGFSSPPGGWMAFDAFSTPDTEPIECDDSFSAYDGNTYLTLVTRGENASMPNTTESCITELYVSLNLDQCYQFSFFLASRIDVGFYTDENGFTPYDKPVLFNVYASTSRGEKGILLYTSDVITHSSWEKYSIRFKAQDSFSFITLEADYPGGITGNGNLAIDKFEILGEESIESIILDQQFTEDEFPVTLNASEGNSYSWTPDEGLSCNNCRSPEASITDSSMFTCVIQDELGCSSKEIFIVKLEINDPDDPDDPEDPPPLDEEFFIPNVFTPNNDGINDYFEIVGIRPYSSLIIFQQEGKMVFQSEDYENNWNGTDINNNELPSGTYWYVLIEPGFGGKRKGYIYLKR